MTVCVAVKVHDCMVFAADSASTLAMTDNDGTQTVLNVYNNADKVFNLHRGLPLMAMTCGMGHIGGRSISSLAKEIRFNFSKGESQLDNETYTVQDVSVRVYDYFSRIFAAEFPDIESRPYFEFWIGGYSAGSSHGEIWKLVFGEDAPDEPQCLIGTDVHESIFWGGQGTAISRLLLGVDESAPYCLMSAGMERPAAMDVFRIIRSANQAPILAATMPTIDAIRLAEFLVDTTKGYFSFAFGSDIVGGQTDIATVTRWEGFKWIKRKHFYPEELNRRDRDHVC